MAFPDPKTISCLSPEEITQSVHLLLSSEISEESKGEFLSTLHQRNETAEELAGFASILLDQAVKPTIPRSKTSPLVELCGTGGDRAGLLNISTAAMFVVAGAGTRVVKHGNRAVSSRCGSADVLEALGIGLHLDPEKISAVLDEAGCVFLLASDFHPTVAVLAPLRRALAAKGQMTIFNLLGPLLNPASPDFQLTGVYSIEVLDLYAEALKTLGRRGAWAVYGEGKPGEGGFDELSILGTSHVAAYNEGSIERITLDPIQLGFQPVNDAHILQGGDTEENAGRILAILSEEERGAARDMITLNAAAALYLAKQSSSLPEALLIAKESIDSGNALRSLEKLCIASQKAKI